MSPIYSRLIHTAVLVGVLIYLGRSNLGLITQATAPCRVAEIHEHRVVLECGGKFTDLNFPDTAARPRASAEETTDQETTGEPDILNGLRALTGQAPTPGAARAKTGGAPRGRHAR